MGILTVNPVPEIFSSIPELPESVNVFSNTRLPQDLIPKLGATFVKYGVQNLFGLSMVHRHFDMASNEILVEMIRDDKSLSVFLPWNLMTGQTASPNDFAMASSYDLGDSKKFIVPQNWCYVDGELQPFEFLSTDDSTLPEPSESFVKELYSILKEAGVEMYVGIRRLLNLAERSSWETTPKGARANVLVFGDQPEHLKGEEMVQVFWAFDDEGKVRPGTAWCGICTHNCGTCSH